MIPKFLPQRLLVARCEMPAVHWQQSVEASITLPYNIARIQKTVLYDDCVVCEDSHGPP